MLGVDSAVEFAEDRRGLVDRLLKLPLLLENNDEYEDFIEAFPRLEATVKEFSNIPGMSTNYVNKRGQRSERVYYDAMVVF